MSQHTFKIEPSARISRLPPYLFARINKMKYDKRVAGVDIIDLGMGNPTDPTPKVVVDKLSEAALDPRNHRYSVHNGIAGLRKEAAKKYKKKYGVDLDPETEVIATIGSKEGFSHMCLALLGPGDMCRKRGVMNIPDVAYGEVCFDGYKAPSLLSAPGAKDRGVEFTTMSRTDNMAGWRVGFCSRDTDMITALGTIKGYHAYGH